jgi:hypothetical protein
MIRKLSLGLLAIAMSLSLSTISVATTHAASHASAPWYAPLLSLPRSDLLRAECVIERESTSTLAHPNLGDDNGNVPGQSGIFQISNSPTGIWDVYVLPRLHVLVWRASAFQQAEGFMIIYRVDGGFASWHRYDGC